jgi:predicted DNA-binding transcriptional regulator AlpA
VPTKPAAAAAPSRAAVSPSGARFLRPEQVEPLYGLSRKYLAHARVRGDGPPFSKAGRKVVLYAVSDIEAWLAARRRLSTADPGPAE